MQLFSLKKEADASAASEAAGASKVSAAQLRAQKDHNELSLPPQCELEFPDPDDLLHFILWIRPDEGLWRGGEFKFTFNIPKGYPHEVPKVHCDTKIYHPNIDLEGNICLNILREDWKPVLNLQTLIYGLVFLMLEPNDDDPLNKEAAKIMQTDRPKFEKNVKRAMRGEYVEGFQFDRCLVK